MVFEIFNLAWVAVMTLVVCCYWVWSEKVGTDWMFYGTSTSWKIEKNKKNKGAGASEAHSQTKEDFSGRDTSRHLKDHWYSCCQTFVALIQPLLLRNSQNMVWLLEPSSKLVLFWFFSIQLLKKHVLNPEITLLYQFHAAKALFKVPIICNISFWIERDLPP